MDQIVSDDVDVGGRPTKFKPEYIGIAKAMAKLGAIDDEIAEALGVARSTFYLWRHTIDGFSDALKLGKEEADDRVEQALYHRALGYSHKTEKLFNQQGEIIRAETTEYYPPDTTAAIFWLKNRRPDQYRQNQNVLESESPELSISISVAEPKSDIEVTRGEPKA